MCSLSDPRPRSPRHPVGDPLAGHAAAEAWRALGLLHVCLEPHRVRGRGGCGATSASGFRDGGASFGAGARAIRMDLSHETG